MKWKMNRLHPLASGVVTLGILQAVQNVDFNQIWFLFLQTILNVVVALLLGGDLSTVFDGGFSSPFGSFFV